MGAIEGRIFERELEGGKSNVILFKLKTYFKKEKRFISSCDF